MHSTNNFSRKGSAFYIGCAMENNVVSAILTRAIGTAVITDVVQCTHNGVISDNDIFLQIACSLAEQIDRLADVCINTYGQAY